MTFKEQTESTTDSGTGARRISWEHDSARNLLARIIDEYPDGNDKIWAQHLQERAPQEGCEFSIYLYFAHNHALALKRKPRKRKYGKPSRAKMRRVKAEMRARLLDLLMPNGKPLRDCTGTECEQFGKADEQRGRWLQRVAEEVGADKRVGDVLDEPKLKALMRTAKADE